MYTRRENIKRVIWIVVASFLYASAINLFIVPAGLYSGGFLGFSQILRTLAERYLDISFNFDISGIISFLMNIPLMLLTYKSIGKEFVIKTTACIALQSLLLSVIPIKQLVTDPLTSVIIGGIMFGTSIGLLLRNGGSSGGVDIVGMYITKKSSLSVGNVSLMIDIFVYACAFLLMMDVEKIIYTLIFAAINMIAIDRMHTQNINSEVIIISKQNHQELQDALMKKIRRGVSYWDGIGAYTQDGNRVFYVIVSKYELPQVKKVVLEIDPHAFISVKNGINVIGNFEKRL